MRVRDARGRGLHARRAERARGVRGRVGVFVGVMYEEYHLYGAPSAEVAEQPYIPGGTLSSIANRVSYFCDFHGPSLTVSTMCSSSLTAIHLACQSLQQGECELALAGGVNVVDSPEQIPRAQPGAVRLQHGAVRELRRRRRRLRPRRGRRRGAAQAALPRAIADRDHIYGVIKGTSINHGGKTNGYTVPNWRRRGGDRGGAREANVDARGELAVERRAGTKYAAQM